MGDVREKMYRICKPLEPRIRKRWHRATGDRQGELAAPYHLFLTLQMQPSRADAPPVWFFLDKVSTRVRYCELDEGRDGRPEFITPEMVQRLSPQPPIVLLHEYAHLEGWTLYDVLDRVVNNSHPISIYSYLRTCDNNIAQALNQVLRKNCWEFVTDICRRFDPDFDPKRLFCPSTGTPLRVIHQTQVQSR